MIEGPINLEELGDFPENLKISEELADLVGKTLVTNISESDISDLIVASGFLSMRIVPHDQGMTMEMNPTRITVKLNPNKKILSVQAQ